MPLDGELSYYSTIGQGGINHALTKPFSEPECGFMLMQIGAIFAVLPPPPAKILECGCGVGWLTKLLQVHGYDCTGIDVSTEAIELARASGPGIQFLAINAEDLAFTEEFDAAFFFDSLHHCLDEEAAIRGVFRALKPGGIFVTSEPGNGHHERSADVIKMYGVTEKDMPASHIVALGKRAGFDKAQLFPRMDDVGRFFLVKHTSTRWWKRILRSSSLLILLNFVRATLKTRRRLDNDMVVLHKP